MTDTDRTVTFSAVERIALRQAIQIANPVDTALWRSIAAKLADDDPSESTLKEDERNRTMLAAAGRTAGVEHTDPCPNDPDGQHHTGCGCDDVCPYCQGAGCDACAPELGDEHAPDPRPEWAYTPTVDARDLAIRDDAGAVVEWHGHVIERHPSGTWRRRGDSHAAATLGEAIDAIAHLHGNTAVWYSASREQRERIERTVTVWHPNGGPVDAVTVPGDSKRMVWVYMADLAMRHPAAIVRHTTHDLESGLPVRVRAGVQRAGDRVAIYRDGVPPGMATPMVTVTEVGHGQWLVQ